MNLENKDDVLSAANAVEVERQQFYARLNSNLLYDVNDGAPGAAHMNSLHSLIESYAHINASSGVAADSADFYNVDRDAAARGLTLTSTTTPPTLTLQGLSTCPTSMSASPRPARQGSRRPPPTEAGYCSQGTTP